MMFKKLYEIFFILTLMLGLFNFKVFAYEYEKNNSIQVLLIYDKSNYFSYNLSTTLCIEELLHHFPVFVKTFSINEYKKNDLKNYDYIFILNVSNELNNSEFLHDLHEFKKDIIWIGKGIDSFLNKTSYYPLKYLGENSDITEIFYSNKKFLIEEKKEFSILTTSSDMVKVYSSISNGVNQYPYAINYKNLWHISRVEENTSTFYIFADLLYDIFKIPSKNLSEISIRIENVNPSTDIKKLKSIGNFLFNEQIPYMISFTPTYLDINNNIVYISTKKDFVETLKYLQNHGASLVLNGYVHENRSIYKEGFEFWNEEIDSPLQLNINTYTKDKIKNSLKECINNDIYPIAFKSPGYAADFKSYLELKKYFSTYVGRFQSGTHKFSTAVFPYVIYDSKYFNKLIPENLGYIDSDNKMYINEILYKLNQLSIVRDFSCGIVFHSSLDIKYLNEIVNEFKKYNIKFLDLKKENNWVKYEGLIVTSNEGKVSFLDQTNILKEKSEPKANSKSYVSTINNFFIVVVFIFCLVFSIIFYISKKRDKKKYLR